MSTRRVGSLAFDHGAQYFTARDERFKHWVYHWMDCGLVQPWNGRIRVLRSGSIEHERRRHERFVGVPGMSALARHLAEGLDIHLQAEVGHVESHGGILLLTDARGDHLGEFDVVVSSAPPPQSAHLLRRVSQVSDQLAQVRMNPCWSVMLAFRHPLEVEFDGAFLHASDVAWAARNSSKPGRDAMDCWVLHASAHWSKTHMKFESGAVIDHLTNSLFRAAGKPRIDPQNAFAHRWRYAQAEHPLRVGAFWDPKSKIGICGDWCANSRIEGAFLSGAAVAGRVLGSLTHIKNDHHVG